MSIVTRIGTQWQPPNLLLLDLPDGRRARCVGVPSKVGWAVRSLDLVVEDARASDSRASDSPPRPDLDPAWIAWLQALLEVGEEPGIEQWRPVIALHGCGELGTAVAIALATAGFERLVLIDETPAAPAGLATTRADVVRGKLSKRGFRGALTGRQWTTGSRWGRQCDLAICLPETAETDRDLTDDLLRADTPHLVTSFVGRSAAVGPLVVPGATPCVRCNDLAAAAIDPDWVPQLAARTRRKVELAPAVSAWVVTTVVQQVLAWQAHGRPETLGATLELDTGDWLLRTRPSTVNAACGCRDTQPPAMHNGTHGSLTPP